MTAKSFLKYKVPFLIAIEPQELEAYSTKIPSKNILVLPFSNKGLGAFPARNFVWEHSRENGHSHHFVFDDNISSFGRLNGGKRTHPYSPKEALHWLEQFSFRYENLAISGFNYSGFLTQETKKPFTFNTHVYSGMLIRNDIPFRWRLKYNEDVDLCLQVLHNKWCTVLFNVFCMMKRSTTEKHPGGNQDELYKNNDPRKKALKVSSLKQIWPQYVKITHRFGRPHHQVSWKKFFKQTLKKKQSEQSAKVKRRKKP